MGKLNYSARKTEGIKAGQVVSKDLKKRITPGIGSKAAARDPTLEIDVSGKNLTDEGFAQFIEDLIECIKYRDEEHLEGAAKVTELHLQGNQLTVLSLQKLSEVIALSAGDLRELDISHNSVCVENLEQMQIWHTFLDSFKNCYMLKKLDIGRNPVGPKGMEVFARVYTQSDLDFIEGDADPVIGLKCDADEEEAVAEDITLLRISNGKENETPKRGPFKKSPNKAKGSKQIAGSNSLAAASKTITKADLKRFACTRGLRSVPYLILSHTNMRLSSAVHLSSILSMHRDREQLLAFLPGGKAPALPDTEERCKRIIWLPNDGLGQLGQKFLDMTERVRENNEDEALNGDDNDHKENHKVDGAAQRCKQKKPSLDIEYTRLTKRIRINALNVEGAQGTQIWRTALKMITVSRALLLEDKDRAINMPSKDESQDENENENENDGNNENDHQNVNENDHQTSTVEEATFEPPAESSTGYYPSSWGIIEPVLQRGTKLFDVNFPALKVPSVPIIVVSGDKDLAPYQEREKSSAPPPPKQTPRSGKGISRHHPVTSVFRKQEWRCGLPFELWRRIIADAVDAEGVLDIQQQKRIITYASDWNAVDYELTIKGAEDHQQIWKLLETVHCFTYSASS